LSGDKAAQDDDNDDDDGDSGDEANLDADSPFQI
jgi:hypothetical protein